MVKTCGMIGWIGQKSIIKNLQGIFYQQEVLLAMASVRCHSYQKRSLSVGVISFLEAVIGGLHHHPFRKNALLSADPFLVVKEKLIDKRPRF